MAARCCLCNKGRSFGAGVATFQLNELWQVLQSRAVMACCTGLPKAVVPLWQLAQLAVTPRWLKVAGDQAIVPWQAAQSCETWTCAVGLPGAAAPLWQLTQLLKRARCSNRAGIHANVVWQSAQAVLLAICVGDLPGARTPLWQLAQAPVTPACDKCGPAAPSTLPEVVALTTGAALCTAMLRSAVPCTRAVAPMTVAIVVCAGAGAAGGFFAAPPPQFLGLWQPLQSLPTWWPLGLVVKLVTPKKLNVDRSWH